MEGELSARELAVVRALKDAEINYVIFVDNEDAPYDFRIGDAEINFTGKYEEKKCHTG